ncbi:MAG: DUF4296 domain-containing protein [Prevotella sp.]|nr:DUF4296 domain-containing protein [Prevotella sp.]
MRLLSRLLCSLMLATTLLAAVGCKPGVPRDLLQPGELEDILYDLHIADGMAVAEGNYQESAYRRLAYRQAVLRKHDVSEALFDSSLVYYYRHTQRLHDIYSNLAKRLDSEAVALGASANELSQFGTIASQGDTATVWNYRQTAVLMPQAPYNTVSFEVKADTAYHKGDKMILSFDGRFIYQDGSRNGAAYLAVIYANDSIATQIVHLGADMHYTVQLNDDYRVGIKLVRGFIHLGRDNTNSPSLKMMTVDNMKLMRMHTSEEDDSEEKANGKPVDDDVDDPHNVPVRGNPTTSVPLKPDVNNGNFPPQAQPMPANGSPGPHGGVPNHP